MLIGFQGFLVGADQYGGDSVTVYQALGGEFYMDFYQVYGIGTWAILFLVVDEEIAEDELFRRLRLYSSLAVGLGFEFMFVYFLF